MIKILNAHLAGNIFQFRQVLFIQLNDVKHLK
jgi:hypothetical protein